MTRIKKQRLVVALKEHYDKRPTRRSSDLTPSIEDNKLEEQNSKDMRIKIPKTTRDDKSCSIMSQSLDLVPIPRKKQNKKVSEISITGNKVTQYPYDTNKEAKVSSSIEGTKQTSLCVTPHPSVLTPPPYKNKQDYEGGTNDKTHYSHTRESGVSRSYDASLARNLDAENKNT